MTMQRITERAIVRTVDLGEKLSPRTQSNDLSSILPPLPDETRQVKLYRLILEVEAAKQIAPLTDQQREVLMRMLHGTGLPIDELARVGSRVAEKTTYGNIAFEHWKSEMDFSGINNRLPDTEPDRYCVDCDANHKWNELSPSFDGTDPRPSPVA